MTTRTHHNEGCPVCGRSDRLDYQETMFEEQDGESYVHVRWYCDACQTPFTETYRLEQVYVEDGR